MSCAPTSAPCTTAACPPTRSPVNWASRGGRRHRWYVTCPASRTPAPHHRPSWAVGSRRGWSVGLTVDADRDWPDQPEHGIEASGLVGVIVAREMRRPGNRVSVCGYLVDTYCLGVKDALGPRSMRRGSLGGFIDRFTAPFGGRPLPSDIELVRHLVRGGVTYARELGLPPHADFRAAAGHLGELEEPCAIQFGHRGRPTYVQGPYDDADRILRALRRSVGPDGFGLTLVEGGAAATVARA